MKKCTFCETENTEESSFCELCGRRFVPTPVADIFTSFVSGEGKSESIRKAQSDDTEIQIQSNIIIPQVGGLYDGKVTRILPIGAFVELAPGKEGLIHVSQLADYRVENVEDVVHIGDMVWVKIIDIDDKGRINLSRKDALHEIKVRRQNGIVVPHTYIKAECQEDSFALKVGGLYDGKVTRVLPIGAFVELAPGKEGLIHVSQLADYRVENVEDVVHIGDMVWVKIIDIDDKGRINLSRKDTLHEIEEI